MRYLSKRLRILLPIKNPNKVPIIYIQSGDEVRALFEYDKIKEVALLSANLNKFDYRYMSLFEIKYDGWKIISNRDAEYKLYGYCKNELLPF